LSEFIETAPSVSSTLTKLVVRSQIPFRRTKMQRQSASERIRAQVIAALDEGGPMSRAALAGELGISRSTASLAVTDLMDQGIVGSAEEGAFPASRRIGRPGSLITLRRAGLHLVGIDFGRLSLKVGLFDAAFRLVEVAEEAFSVDIPAQVAIATAAARVEHLLSRHGLSASEIEAAAIGVPGPVDAETGELHAGSILARWVGTDVTGDLARRLGVPVYMDNDANLGILAETRIGAAQESRVALYVLLSVGVGLGIALDGTVFRGTRGIAGELGHVVTNESGPLCPCGSRGCLEAQISVNALAASLSATHGAISPAVMLELAAQGDLGARRIVDDAATLAGKAIGALCNYFNPDTVIISGELVRAGPVVLDSIRSAMTRVSLPRAIENVDLRLGDLGELAELYGAVFFAKQRSIRQGMASPRGRAAASASR
jgi:predicted NBD/HSP70 family sugar kinase